MEIREGQARPISAKDILIGVLVLGSIWGFFEVVVGGGMKAAGIPYKGDLLTGLGIGTMAVALALYRKPLMLPGIAIVAIAVKQLAVPILHLSFICKANSCLAVMLGGCALAGTAALAGRRLHSSLGARATAGLSAGLLAGTGFYFMGMRAAPCPYLLSFNRPGGFIAFMFAEGLIWAALGAVFSPLGYWIGERLLQGAARLRDKRPTVYYSASLALAACCWIASAFAIASF